MNEEKYACQRSFQSEASKHVAGYLYFCERSRECQWLPQPYRPPVFGEPLAQQYAVTQSTPRPTIVTGHLITYAYLLP